MNQSESEGVRGNEKSPEGLRRTQNPRHLTSTKISVKVCSSRAQPSSLSIASASALATSGSAGRASASGAPPFTSPLGKAAPNGRRSPTRDEGREATWRGERGSEGIGRNRKESEGIGRDRKGSEGVAREATWLPSASSAAVGGAPVREPAGEGDAAPAGTDVGVPGGDAPAAAPSRRAEAREDRHEDRPDVEARPAEAAYLRGCAPHGAQHGAPQGARHGARHGGRWETVCAVEGCRTVAGRLWKAEARGGALEKEGAHDGQLC